MRVYLDHNATAPLRVEARDAMIAAMDVVGNPSSVHGEGRAAKAGAERQTFITSAGAPTESTEVEGAGAAAATEAVGDAV